MDQYRETFETWNKLANLYQDKFMDLDLYNETYDQFCNAINTPAAQILEIACGPGNISKYLLSKRPDFRILGIDIAPNMIELARKNIPTAQFKVMDCREISALDQLFEGIVCGFGIPYLTEADCEKLIWDVCALLQPGGMLYLSFVDGPPENSGYQIGSSGDRMFFYYHEVERIDVLLVEAGFEPAQRHQVPYQRNTGVSEAHTILMTQKKIFRDNDFPA